MFQIFLGDLSNCTLFKKKRGGSTEIAVFFMTQIQFTFNVHLFSYLGNINRLCHRNDTQTTYTPVTQMNNTKKGSKLFTGYLLSDFSLLLSLEFS